MNPLESLDAGFKQVWTELKNSIPLNNSDLEEMGENAQEVMISQLLSSFNPFIGCIGKLVFYHLSFSVPGGLKEVLHSRYSGKDDFHIFKVNTYHNIERKISGRFEDHAVINNYPVTEYLGRDLDSFSIDVLFHSSLGVEPLGQYMKIKRMLESGNPQIVILNGRIEGMFTLRSVTASEQSWSVKTGNTVLSGGGRPSIITATLELKQYIKPSEIKRYAEERSGVEDSNSREVVEKEETNTEETSDVGNTEVTTEVGDGE